MRRNPINVKEVTTLPGKDLSRWQTDGDGVWTRRLGEHAEQGIKATESAVKTAAELDVDLGEVVGSGKEGRITKADVETHASD